MAEPGRSPFSIRRLVVFLAVLYVATAAAFWVLAPLVAFQPPGPSYGATDPGIVLLEEYQAPTIALRYLTGPPGGPVLLMCHGNAEDLGHVEDYQLAVHARGIAVCAWDYPGYGASSGEPGFAAIESGARRVHGWLVSQGVAAERIIPWGRSLGGGPACHLLLAKPVAGVVLESTFASINRSVTGIPLVYPDRWTNADAVAASDKPVLVIHSTTDRVIAPGQGRALAAAAGDRAETLWLDGVDHNSGDYAARAAAIAAFARRVVGP